MEGMKYLEPKLVNEYGVTYHICPNCEAILTYYYDPECHEMIYPHHCPKCEVLLKWEDKSSYYINKMIQRTIQRTRKHTKHNLEEK